MCRWDDNVRVRLGVNHEERNGFLENITGTGPMTSAASITPQRA